MRECIVTCCIANPNLPGSNSSKLLLTLCKHIDVYTSTVDFLSTKMMLA